MAKPKLVVLKGLPASGKSTFAEKLTKLGFVRTNKDDIREQLYKGNWKRKDEKQVLRVRNSIIEDALSHNKSVVVDDTNLNPVHIKDLAAIAKKHNVTFEVEDSFLAVPIEVCIKRDLQRPKSVGESVIRSMYHQYIKKAPQQVEYDPNLPNCIIVDIDGTLAHMVDRNPYDWHKVQSDVVDAGVAHLVDAVGMMKYAKVFIFSGRSNGCRPETTEWLERNDIEYDLLAMRPEERISDDDREIKADMLKEHVIGQYNVLFVVDDRPKVCRMWRDEFGLRVLQVGDPHYDF